MMNWLKDTMKEKETTHGVWLTMGSPIAAEIAAEIGFDWALIDMEHGFSNEASMLQLLQIFSHTHTAPIVRVPSGTAELLQKALDFGASGIMAPMIDTLEQAIAFVRALRYPPAGVRGMTASSRASGYGCHFKEYYAKANQGVLGIVQIETSAGLENVDAIAAIDGVDVLFIGHSDLSLALGCYGDFNAEIMLQAEAKVLAACQKHQKILGMLLKSGASAQEYSQKGFRFLGLGSDLSCMRQGLQQLKKENK